MREAKHFGELLCSFRWQQADEACPQGAVAKKLRPGPERSHEIAKPLALKCFGIDRGEQVPDWRGYKRSEIFVGC
jgi:hypothetical protein